MKVQERSKKTQTVFDVHVCSDSGRGPGWCRIREKEKDRSAMAVDRDSGGNIRWGRGLGGKNWEKRAKIPHEKEREHVDTKGWRMVSEMAEKYGDSRNTTAKAAAEAVELRGKEMCVGKGEMSTEKSEDSWSENVARFFCSVAGRRSLTGMVGRAIGGLRRQSMKHRLLGFLSLIREEWGNKKKRGEENQCKAMEIRRRKSVGWPARWERELPARWKRGLPAT